MTNSDYFLAHGVDIDGFTLVHSIGIGGTAEVWEAEDRHLKKWAIKVFSPERRMDNNAIQLFEDEYKMTEGLNHPNILKPLKYSRHKGRPYMVFELCDSSLRQQLHERVRAARVVGLKDFQIFKEEEMADILLQISSALSYLHNLPDEMIHQDVKPDNIVIKEKSKEYLLTDFGVSNNIKMTILRDSQTLPDDAKGITPDYAAPEQYHGMVLPASDVFSLGITLYELCVGKPPMASNRMTTSMALINGGEVPDLPEHYSSSFSKIVQQCLSLEPQKRPTADMLMRWASFYKRDGYWPAESTQNIKQKPKSKKFLTSKVLNGIIGVLLLLSLGFLGKSYLTTDYTKELKTALTNYDFERLKSIYPELPEELRAKYQNLLNIELIRIDRVQKNHYAIVRHTETDKLGIVNNSGSILIPCLYEAIYRVKNPNLITVKHHKACKIVDINHNIIKETNHECRSYAHVDELKPKKRR